MESYSVDFQGIFSPLALLRNIGFDQGMFSRWSERVLNRLDHTQPLWTGAHLMFHSIIVIQTSMHLDDTYSFISSVKLNRFFFRPWW